MSAGSTSTAHEIDWNLPKDDYANITTDECYATIQLFDKFYNREGEIIQNNLGSCFVNLTLFYDDFWENLFGTQLFQGNVLKIPNEACSEIVLTKTAKILKHCWENQHYFPNKLFQPFLEICILNRTEDFGEKKMELRKKEQELINKIEEVCAKEKDLEEEKLNLGEELVIKEEGLEEEQQNLGEELCVSSKAEELGEELQKLGEKLQELGEKLQEFGKIEKELGKMNEKLGDFLVNLIEVRKEMFLDFIKKEDRAALDRTNYVAECLLILKKYSRHDFLGENILLSTKLDAIELSGRSFVKRMVLDRSQAVKIWTQELVGMLELAEIRYLMNPCKRVIEEESEYDDLKDCTKLLPHKLWRTFFYEWSDEKIVFYFDLLKKGVNYWCCFCKEYVTKQTFIGTERNVCWEIIKTLCKERHDCVLRTIEKQLIKAIERRTGEHFKEGKWEYLIAYGNAKYTWPPDLGKYILFPDIVAYSLEERTKKVLIIELGICWEPWFELSGSQKKEKYLKLVNVLKRKRFHVELLVIMLGCRGVLSDDYNLYALFKNTFGMTHQISSRVIEKISRKIISVNYDSFVFHNERKSGGKRRRTSSE